MSDDGESPRYRIAIGPALTGKLAPGDPYWRVFNGSFENQELTSLEVASLLYEGHAITTWHKDRWRLGENFICGQHIGVDFDTGDERSSLPALMQDPLFKAHGAIAYTTPSHSPESPRARMVFFLDEPIESARGYTMAAEALLAIYGTADHQCKDPVRFFYGGRPGVCEMEWNERVLPLAKLRSMVKIHQSMSRAAAPRPHRSYEAQDDDEVRVMAALKYIPPWGVPYETWLSVLMGIHSAFPGSNGLSMAESWGQGYEGEVARKWRSFHEAGNTSGRVTVASIFAIAKDYGFQGGTP